MLSLINPSKKWNWGEGEEAAFISLKEAVTSAPVLMFPSDTRHFCLECDASGFATSAVLSQVQANGLYHPVGFMSKSLSNVQWNHQVYNKELLAIIQALKEWQHFLEGAAQPFKIFTDH